ncbi:MAG: methyltransferase domain-containing protein [Myxococcaceae bacterium]|nr:methyltransferase domain-containing protein [Myxococcaceae bacterium]
MSTTSIEQRSSNGATQVGQMFQGAVRAEQVQSTVDNYEAKFEKSGDERRAAAVEVARDYYQLVTDFFEYGWGQSFHFAPLRHTEETKESIRLHEQKLALRLGLKPGMRVLDAGCGVGGPMRAIAAISGSKITGVTISPYQIQRIGLLNQKAGLSHLCEGVEADFNKLPMADNTFDAAYEIEACCHAADRRGPFKEIFRTLKPGALFAGYDWVMTERYIAGDAEHERVKLGVEKGNGLPPMVRYGELDACLKDSGFEILETRDMRHDGDADLPWYTPLDSGVSLQGFRNSRAGAFATHQMVRILEKARIAPKGTLQMHGVLRLAQQALVEAGKLDIFTPMYFWVARKPK